MPTYFTAGEFARIHGISKQTVLYYDKIKLLSPSYVEKSNGYRYYDSTQLEVLDTIFILKDMGVPLKKIKLYLENRTTSDAIRLLQVQKEKMDNAIAEQIMVRSRLAQKLETLKAAGSLIPDGKVSYTHCKPQYLFCEPVEAPFHPIDTDLAMKRLFNNLSTRKYSYGYQSGVIIPKDHLVKGDNLSACKVFTILDEIVTDSNFLIKPEAFYATTYHKGSYQNEGITYRPFLQQITMDGYDISGDSYEESLIDHLSTGNSNNYLTKISVQVKKQ